MVFEVGLIEEARKRLFGVAQVTGLQHDRCLCNTYDAHVYLKREDQQPVRSFKLRGAYNKIASLSTDERTKGIVCASAGNHAQGVAYSCQRLKVRGVIYMPTTAPQQKVDRVRDIGGAYVEVRLLGKTFDDAATGAREAVDTEGLIMVHPFDDPHVIAGQGTIGAEILEQSDRPIDYVFVPVGGGGMAAGIGSYLRAKSPCTHVIGVEPIGAASMYTSLAVGSVTPLDTVDVFVDGVAVKRVGDLTFSVCKDALDSVVRVPEGKVCEAMISLYQRAGIIVEPSGALSIAALDLFGVALKGKTIVCIVSGGNNDLYRYPEVIERSLAYRSAQSTVCGILSI